MPVEHIDNDDFNQCWRLDTRKDQRLKLSEQYLEKLIAFLLYMR